MMESVYLFMYDHPGVVILGVSFGALWMLALALLLPEIVRDHEGED